MNRHLAYLSLILLVACSSEEPPAPAASSALTPSGSVAQNDVSVRDVARSPTSDNSAGRAVYEHYCADCHNGGEGHPGTMRLALRLDNGVLRERNDLHPDYVKVIVRNGLQMMPPFRPTEIADSELDALAAYVTQGNIK